MAAAPYIAADGSQRSRELALRMALGARARGAWIATVVSGCWLGLAMGIKALFL